MFQFNLNDYSTHFYSDIQSAYKAYLQFFVTEGDYDYYKSCCGLNLNDITDPKIMDSIFRNVFENVIFSGEVDRVLSTK